MEQKYQITMHWREDGPDLEERIALWRYHFQRTRLQFVAEEGMERDSMRQLSENIQRTPPGRTK